MVKCKTCGTEVRNLKKHLCTSKNVNFTHGIALAEGEKVVREYEATILENPRATGYLIATNRRLIFSGQGRNKLGYSMIARDVQIDKVTGIQSYLAKGFSMTKFVVSIFLILLFVILAKWHVAFYLGLFLPAYLIYRMIRNPGNQMKLIVMASDQTASAVGVAVTEATGLFGNAMNILGIGGNHATMAVSSAGAGKHTEIMMRELGALVLDIQAQGDHALLRWGVPTEEEKKETKKQPVIAGVDEDDDEGDGYFG